jgi:GT2 family glycosyltransferase
MDRHPIDATVVVPCRDERKGIAAFLESVEGQRLNGLAVEIVFADGMSTDGTRAIIQEFGLRHPEVRMVDNPAGFTPHGLNLAIRAARGEFILRMDVHTEYGPDYIATCVEALRSSQADNAGGPARTRASGYAAKAIAAAYHSPFACGGARFHDETYEGFVDTVPYGCWRRSLFDRIGYFDEALIRNQDDEFNLRLVRRGGRIWQTPRIVSWYHPRSSLTALARQYFQYGFWKVAVIRKHRVPASWRHLVPVLFVAGFALLMAVWIAAALAADTAASHRAAVLLACGLGAYLLPALAASFAAAKRQWRLLPILPATFLVYHAAYGAGFLAGLLRAFASGREPGFQRAFTSITR